MKRRLSVAAVACVVCIWSRPAEAQWEVTDPANTARQSITATIKTRVLGTIAKSNAALGTMSARLQQFQDMRDYVVSKVVSWVDLPTSYVQETVTYARDFMRVLEAGGQLADSVRRIDIDPRYPVESAIASALGTLDLADGVLASGLDLAGRIRNSGRAEAALLARLERDVTRGGDGSTTVVLDILSAAALIRARQQETRLQLTSTLVEALIVDNTRERQTEAAAMRMRAGVLNHPENLEAAAGSDQALRTWRQP